MRSKFFLITILLVSICASSFGNQFVSSLSIFSGEVASNLTAGAPLSVSSTGKVASGLSVTEVSATADTTTTSTTDVLINSMTETPASGTYIVWFDTCVDHSAQSVAVVVSLYVGGTLKADSVRSPVPRFNGVGANTLTPCISINGKVTVNGSQAIEARWKTASGTATAHQRTMNVLRVL